MRSDPNPQHFGCFFFGRQGGPKRGKLSFFIAEIHRWKIYVIFSWAFVLIFFFKALIMLEFSANISMFVQKLWSRDVSRISLQLGCPTLGKGTSSIKGDMFSLPKWYWNHGLEATGAHEALVLTHLIQRFSYRFGRAIVAKALAANKKCTNEAYHMKQRSHTDLLWTIHFLIIHAKLSEYAVSGWIPRPFWVK